MPGKVALETLASGYGLIEGPRVDDDDGLYFSDVRDGGVYRRAATGEIETVVPKRRGVGGIALHAAGGIVVSGRNICHVVDGASRIIFDIEGVPGFNDLFTNGAGQILVGSMRSNPFEFNADRETGELYCIEAEGKAAELYDDISLTNGIGFSPDERTLYHSDTARNHVIVHDVATDGTCTNRRVLAEAERGSPDGLAVDESGCIWFAAYGGGCVSRHTPAGKLDLHIDIPAKAVTSLCFGGGDRRDLYIVSADNVERPEAKGTIFRTRVEVPGLAAPLARI